MIGKQFDAISKDDIDSLVKDCVAEGRTLDYKEQLPGKTDEEVREFLADVSSFANSGGGDLIYGMREQRNSDKKPTGVPDSAGGLAGITPDAEKGRLENVIRDGIDPRIPGVRIKPVDGFPNGPVILVRVPQSWASPHMVKFKNLSRFFSRNSGGKYQLDVREIRAAFLGSQNLADKISAFRSDRVSKIFAGWVTLSTEHLPKVVLHLLPVTSFLETVALDLKIVEKVCPHLKPMGSPDQWGPGQYNFDGLYSSGKRHAPNSNCYVQIFRNGAVEAVCPILTHEKLLCGSQFEQELIRFAPGYIKLQNQLELGQPLFAAISLVSVKGYYVTPTLNSMWPWPSANFIDRDILLAPEVLIEEEGVDFGKSIRSALDTLWQASGWPGSQGYDESGKWVGYLRN